MLRPPPRSALFPYTTLFRSLTGFAGGTPMSREQITRGRRDFMTTLGRGGLAASLMGGGVLGAWGAMNMALGQPLPGPLRIHGNPVATRDKNMKPFKQQYDVDLQTQLSVTH